MLNNIGFGRTAENKPATDRLMHVNISYVTNEECSNAFKRPIPDNQMCAGETINGGKDACNGDSGGPLLYSGIVVGVTSWGVGCGTTKPAGYSRIADQFEWIKDIVCTHHTPGNAPPFCGASETTPTESPSTSPSSSPVISPTCPPDKKKNAKFWDGTMKKKKNGKWKIGKKRCGWLQKKASEAEQNKMCAMTDGRGKLRPAREVCTGTCNSC